MKKIVVVFCLSWCFLFMVNCNKDSDGLVKGVLLKQETTDCPWLIRVEDKLLVPENLDQSKITMTDRQPVWLKYEYSWCGTTVCNDATPVIIKIIKNR